MCINNLGTNIRPHLMVTEGEQLYQTIVKAKPIPHYYDEAKTYIKYRCPICEVCDIHLAITSDLDNCPCCNINLDWEGVRP